ncbi:MAG: dimethyl sulfoxide reductase anchor subunit [Proteobacteria bacterium]|nr:dimethyl sulfoxide reductase anchor subunit [Pseudomonadota bacterium]MBS0572364.1 dimethyl sulfoxide reductase anchor subunit [Pseudomonadota bacterium]
MHPAPSVIIFTVLSGVGFGFLGALDLGLMPVQGGAALVAFGLAYLLAVAGLVASTFHLGNPQRALRAFTQWRTSWLSREGWASVAALAASAPVALAAAFRPGMMLAGHLPGLIAAAFCVLTILCTSMIYAQLRTVPRWHHWTTPVLFLAFAAAGGAILALPGPVAAAACLVSGGAMLLAFALGDGRFARQGQSPAAATGLGPRVRPFAPPHTSPNYVMREMIHHVGRKHARRLRLIALGLGAGLPALLMLVLPAGLLASALALIPHLAGALAQRWLFFAEAEHVVGHYYGRAADAARGTA